ncbi:thioesterase family protein [Microbacterium sp. NPDC055910]|uniref:thioesterase family protein n=1 Tax=Microbacterium sp. NPDC055910 TaxID=3345659 RepID=UPI0035E04449
MPRDSYFVPAGPDRYLPTDHVGGAWSDEDLHVATVAGLLVHHMDRWRREHGDADKVFGRISIDILGRLTRGDIELETRLIRPGRTIELLETTATIAGRPTLAARAWLLATEDTQQVAGGEWMPLPAPDAQAVYPIAELWRGGYISSIRALAVGPRRPGRAAAWLTTELDLVAGEETSELARFVALVDTANGIAVRQSPDEWLFPNLDLTLHFFRSPSGAWVGLDTTVTYGPAGLGLTSTVLHDLDGPVGTAQQILTVRSRAT